MKSNVKINLILMAGVVVMLGFIFSAKLPTKTITVQKANLGAVLQVKSWTLIDKVEEAQKLLASSPALETIEIRGKLVRKQIELAILDLETGRIFLRRYWLEDKDIRLAASLARAYLPNPSNLPRFEPVDPAEEFEIINNWWNGWASDWAVERFDDPRSGIYVVIADKYSLPNSYIINPDERTGSKYSDIVFSPNSAGIYDQEIVARGKNFLTDHVKLAFQELRDLQVMSKAFPEKLVVDTISEEFVKNILIVEQTDPKAILTVAQTEEEQRRVAEKVLLRYGLNGEKAFRYTVSSAGAVGPAQVMAATGNSIIKRYPEANLIKDINAGRIDIGNAIKLAILVFDDHFASALGRINGYQSGISRLALKTPQEIEEMKGAIYNGGASKIIPQTAVISSAVSETVHYVSKLKIIRALNLFVE